MPRRVHDLSQAATGTATDRAAAACGLDTITCPLSRHPAVALRMLSLAAQGPRPPAVALAVYCLACLFVSMLSLDVVGAWDSYYAGTSALADPQYALPLHAACRPHRQRRCALLLCEIR
jgi:hypothetical protein